MATVIAVGMLGAPQGAAAAVKIGAPAAKPASLSAGTSSRTAVTVRNTGRRTAKARLDLLLSADARRSKPDRLLARRTAKVKPGKRRTVTARVTVPAATAAGAYKLLACVKRRCRARSLTVTGGPDPSPTPSPTPVPTPTATPADFAPALDMARAASGTFTAATGGTLEATAADGTTFRLTVPAGALLSDLDITMTPLASAAGLPYGGGLVGAVQLAPDGLELIEPGRLVITPPAGLALDRQSPFGWRSDDDDLHNTFQTDFSAGTVTLPISHFSGAGLASGSAQDRVAQAEKELQDRRADFENKLSQLLDESQRTGGEVPTEALVALMKQHHAEVVKPDLTAALTNDSMFWLAVMEVLAFDRNAEQINAIAQLNAELGFNGAQIDDAARNYFDRAYASCLDQTDPAHGFRMWTLKRFVARSWLNRWDPPVLPGNRISKCLRFELGISGTVGIHHATGTSETVTVSTPTRTAFYLDDAYLFPQQVNVGTLSIDSATMADENCVYTHTGQESLSEPVQVDEMYLDYNLVGNASPDVPDMRLDVRPGVRKAIMTADCGAEGGIYEVLLSTWRQVWETAHADHRLGSAYRIRNWAEVGQGGVWAHKVYARSVVVDATTTHTEDVRITLHHTPQP